MYGRFSDTHRLFGQPLRAYCILETKKWNSSGITFIYNNNEMGRSYVRLINESVAWLDLPMNNETDVVGRLSCNVNTTKTREIYLQFGCE